MNLDLHVEAHSSTSISPPRAEPCTDLNRAGLPSVPGLARDLDSVGIEPNAVARVIEELKRSGYRPLHARLTAPEPSSILRARVAQGRNV